MALLFENKYLTLAKQPIEGENIYLRLPERRDYAQWHEIRKINRAFLQPFEPTWGHDAISKSQFFARVRNDRHDASTDSKYAFFIFRKSDNALIGGINMNNVQRGVFQCCALGYWMGEAINSKGFMTEAVQILLAECFGKWGFNRVQAATLLGNHASIRVLTKNGFEREGQAKRYLKINGQWQDHALFAKVRS